ncbi:TPA: hypothetical protein R8G57_001495 [Citrobacter freundii]|nr:hypothetical protein [Citrobacter freundii]
MKQIKHQKQGDRDCVCTCIAMIAGIKKRIIRNRYHDRYMNEHNFKEDKILDDLGIKYTTCNNSTVIKGKVYLATVPSINMLGYFHQVIIDARESMQVFDPNRGVKGRNYYVTKVSPTSSKQIKMHSWILDYEIYL